MKNMTEADIPLNISLFLLKEMFQAWQGDSLAEKKTCSLLFYMTANKMLTESLEQNKILLFIYLSIPQRCLSWQGYVFLGQCFVCVCCDTRSCHITEMCR